MESNALVFVAWCQQIELHLGSQEQGRKGKTPELSLAPGLQGLLASSGTHSGSVSSPSWFLSLGDAQEMEQF